jgi:hypothetical protein
MRRISASLIAPGVRWTITVSLAVVCFSVTWQINTPVDSNEVVLEADLEIITQITTQIIEFIQLTVQIATQSTAIIATLDQHTTL